MDDILGVVSSAVGVPFKLASIIIPPPEQYSSAQGPPSRLLQEIEDSPDDPTS